MVISERPWFADMENYKETNVVQREYTWQQRKHFYKEVNFYLSDDPYLFKRSPDSLLHMCVAGREADSIMWHCHNSAFGGHRNGERMEAKILKSGFWRLTLFNDCNYMCLHALNVTKPVSSQNETKCL